MFLSIVLMIPSTLAAELLSSLRISLMISVAITSKAGYGRGNIVVRNCRLRYIVPVKTLREKAAKQICNVSRSVGGDIIKADKVRDGILGGLGFYVAPKRFPGDALSSKLEYKLCSAYLI